MKAIEILKDIQESKWCGVKITLQNITLEQVNEAIKELEDIQNKSCENCLYGNDLIKNHNKLVCHLNVSEKSKSNIIAEVSKEFYCNKWSAK